MSEWHPIAKLDQTAHLRVAAAGPGMILLDSRPLRVRMDDGREMTAMLGACNGPLIGGRWEGPTWKTAEGEPIDGTVTHYRRLTTYEMYQWRSAIY